MYCTNCKCDSCQALRLASGSYSRVEEDVLRLIIGSKDLGMTKAELVRCSRPFRTLDDAAKGLLLDRLVAEGKLIEHTFPTRLGRGKTRHAYLFVQVSQ